MALMQSEKTQQAIVLANESTFNHRRTNMIWLITLLIVIEYEPNNAIIQQLLPLLKQKQELSLGEWVQVKKIR